MVHHNISLMVNAMTKMESTKIYLVYAAFFHLLGPYEWLRKCPILRENLYLFHRYVVPMTVDDKRSLQSFYFADFVEKMPKGPGFGCDNLVIV